MSDLEWYLEIGGKQSGPHAAKEIVDLVRAGRIPVTAQVTAARMSGDWVTAKDLVDAYDELYQKTSIPKPVSGEATVVLNRASFSGSGDPNFQAPPRPTEQLEATKNIFLNREDLDNTPDPTEALFQAIQAVREKAAGSASGNTGIIQRPTSGPLSAKGESPKFPPQILLIATLAAIFGVTIYGITLLLGNKKPDAVVKKAPVSDKKEIRPETPTGTTAGASKLLGDDGRGTIAPRHAPAPHSAGLSVAPPNSRGMPSRLGGRPERGGGARYREDQDTRDDEADVDEVEPNINAAPPFPGQMPPPMPVDPAQVPVAPDSGLAPENERN